LKTKVLWVEDSARLELRKLTGPVYISGNYDMNLAEDVTSAVRYLQSKIYDAVVLDMRLPPGIDEYWIKLYEERGADKASARLGLELATWMFKGHSLYPVSPPDWITPYHVGVFTVENDLALHRKLEELNIKVFQHKTAGIADTILIEVIEKIVKQRAGVHHREGGLNGDSV
jgi:hypothetical protein